MSAAAFLCICLFMSQYDLSGSLMRKNWRCYPCGASRARLQLCCVTQCMHADYYPEQGVVLKIYWVFVVYKKYFVLIRLFETFSFGSMKCLLSFLLTGQSVYPRWMNILQYKILFFMVDLFVARGPFRLLCQLCHIYLQINWLPKYISVTYDRCANVYSNELDTKQNTDESFAN